MDFMKHNEEIYLKIELMTVKFIQKWKFENIKLARMVTNGGRFTKNTFSSIWGPLSRGYIMKLIVSRGHTVSHGLDDKMKGDFEIISLYSTLYTVQTSNTPCPHTSCKVH
jgi:hypothetical protein